MLVKNIPYEARLDKSKVSFGFEIFLKHDTTTKWTLNLRPYSDLDLKIEDLQTLS